MFLCPSLKSLQIQSILSGHLHISSNCVLLQLSYCFASHRVHFGEGGLETKSATTLSPENIIVVIYFPNFRCNSTKRTSWQLHSPMGEYSSRGRISLWFPHHYWFPGANCKHNRLEVTTTTDRRRRPGNSGAFNSIFVLLFPIITFLCPTPIWRH